MGKQRNQSVPLGLVKRTARRRRAHAGQKEPPRCGSVSLSGEREARNSVLGSGGPAQR